MKIALLVNRENFEKFAPAVPESWQLFHMGNGELDIEKVVATEADVLVVDAIMKIGVALTARMPQLKLINSQGVAYNGIDLEETRKSDIFVCNNPGINAQAVAEQAILLMLCLLRSFRRNEDMVYSGAQIQAKTACFKAGQVELGELHVGIVGMGAIGLALAERLRAFGCRLSYFSRTKKHDYGIAYLPLQELYETCDIISLHTPVTEETVGMISDAALAHFRPGAMLINTARGELVDQPAVIRALTSGRLSGFGADTLSPEPVLSDNEFLTLLPHALRHHVCLSPHIAGITLACFARAYKHIFSNIAAIESRRRPTGIVNGL